MILSTIKLGSNAKTRYFFHVPGGSLVAKSKFIIHKNHDYTIMSNRYFLDKSMSCDAKGLLAIMLSFQEGTTFQISDLEAVCMESRSQILDVLEELKRFGYVGLAETNEYLVKEGGEIACV